MSNILGISAGFHDASVSLISNTGEILFAGHSERYSKQKNDENINLDLLTDAERYGTIDRVAYYERPVLKQLRQLYSGQGIEWRKLSVSRLLDDQLKTNYIWPKISTHGHHQSHAAAGFQTSPFDDATVVVIDAIGEWDTVSIWYAYYDRSGQAVYEKKWSQRYPHSIGLFYSAMTDRVGLKPNEEEYILMGMSAYGKTSFHNKIINDLVYDEYDIKFSQNMHAGIDAGYLSHVDEMDLALTAQVTVERLIYNVMHRARAMKLSNNLVYMGGVALNCSANKELGDYFENIWIMPNPGDAGSSLGAAALAYGSRLHWRSPYLGYNIPGAYPIGDLLDCLLRDRMVGVASGRAEFGPRALGNRSLLADPRGDDIKDLVNSIKRRQKFRPFAPVILEELAEEYFEMPKGWQTSPYMQTVARCRRPELFPAIIHADGTSRVQTVAKDSGSGIRELLEKWYIWTGCPMLLNTSLNIRGEPMVNDRADADRFEKLYGVKVCS